MGLFSWAKGQFIDVIEWPNQEANVLVWKFPDTDHEIKNGAQLTVRETQAVVLVNEGQVADVFGPGRHELATRNMPILTSLRSWKYGFESPFKVDVYFISLAPMMNQKWGTRAPVRVYDPEFPSGVDMRAFGTFSFRVTDPGTFFRGFSGNRTSVTTEDMLGQFRSMMATEFSAALKKAGTSLREIDANAHELGEQLLPIMQSDFAEIGCELMKFLVESVTLPEEIRAELAAQDLEARKLRRSGTAQNEVELQNLMAKAQLSQNVGDMGKLMQLQAAAGMGQGGSAGGSGDLSQMMQMMLGMGMGQQMLQNLQNTQSAAPGQAPNTEDAQEAQRAKVLNTLKQLGELKAAGVLSEEEFAAKKNELLSKL